MSKVRALRVGGPVLALIFLVSSPAQAQESTSGEIRGTVKDSVGGALPGVILTGVQTQTGETRSATTGEAGQYRLPAMSLGSYAITAYLQGFNQVRREGITLSLGQTLTVDFTLEVGGVEETLTVTGGAPLIDVTQIEVSGLLLPSQIVSLPLERFLLVRSTAAVVLLSPEVPWQRIRWICGSALRERGIRGWTPRASRQSTT